MDATIADFPEFASENRIALVYPFGKILYINQHNKKAFEMLKYGLEQAVADRSFYKLFNHHFAQHLDKHQFYFRKIMLIQNPTLSASGMQAINQFGIASFSNTKQ